jgi:hypothetical protein
MCAPLKRNREMKSCRHMLQRHIFCSGKLRPSLQHWRSGAVSTKCRASLFVLTPCTKIPTSRLQKRALANIHVQVHVFSVGESMDRRHRDGGRCAEYLEIFMYSVIKSTSKRWRSLDIMGEDANIMRLLSLRCVICMC